MNRELHDSLFELYIADGLELITIGPRGLKRELIIDLETSALTPEKGEIIHYRAVNRWDENDEFDEWAKPSQPLPPEAERILGVTNEQLAHCRSSDILIADFFHFLGAGTVRMDHSIPSEYSNDKGCHSDADLYSLSANSSPYLLANSAKEIASLSLKLSPQALQK